MTYCKAYQKKRKAGQPCCPTIASECIGWHYCSKCGARGHGAEDCRKPQQPFNLFGTGNRRNAAASSRETLQQIWTPPLPAAAPTSAVAAPPAPAPLLPASLGCLLSDLNCLPAPTSAVTAPAAPAPLLPAAAPTSAVAAPAAPVPAVPFQIWRPTHLTIHGAGALFQFICSALSKAKASRIALAIDWYPITPRTIPGAFQMLAQIGLTMCSSSLIP